MKRTLLATTALVAFAGVAAADIEITGSAEMGLVGGDYRFKNAEGDGETQFWNDVDVKFTMTGETDSGISFGTSVDLDEAPKLGNETGNEGIAVFISGGFGTLTLGDTDGALDWASTEVGNVANPGTISDVETEHAGYNGSYLDGSYDGQILRYDYSFGDFGFAISAEMDDYGTDDDPATPLPADETDGPEDPGFAVGLKYSADLGGVGLDLGLGFQTAEARSFGNDKLISGAKVTIEDVEVIGFSVAADFGSGFEAGLQYSAWDFELAGDDDNASHLGLGVGYSSGPLSLHANYGIYEVDDADLTLSGFALVGAYDLGGGASVHAGYAISDVELGSDDEDGDDFTLGMSFKF